VSHDEEGDELKRARERIAELERENDELKRERDDLQRQLDDDGDEESTDASANETRGDAGAQQPKPTASVPANVAELEAQLRDQTAKMADLTAKTAATTCFRSALSEGRVTAAEKTVFVGRLAAALLDVDALPDEWDGVVAHCKTSQRAAASEWLSAFGSRAANGAVDLGIQTTGAPGGNGPTFAQVRAALMTPDGLTDDLVGSLGLSGTPPKGLGPAEATSWIVKNAPALYVALNKI